jgi:hypothetical protein
MPEFAASNHRISGGCFYIFAPLQDGEAGNRMTQVKARYLRKN